MIVNAAVFTCSICGEASVNICSYCTKDACSNHRCERCKRCSDCCECEFPLSAEEPVAMEPVTEMLLDPELLPQSALQTAEPEAAEPHTAGPEAAEPGAENSVPPAPSPMADFLTKEESSVFAPESGPTEPRVFGESSVFAPEPEEEDEDRDPLEPGA